ncbi:NlpC/P60 family protein [Deminuibacter soli]|nr:NlpC/P60 family protein [Deminuibacter soli]
MKNRKLGLCCCVALLVFSSCKSLKNAGSADHSNSAPAKQGKKSGNVQFIDGIAVTPGTIVTSKHSSNGDIPGNKKVIYAPPDDVNSTHFNIETADWLQLKYAIVLDASIEKLTNVDLLKIIDHWWGTRYALGGSTENGIDCSAFSLTVERDVYGKSVPRTAQEQYDQTQRVEENDLREGDLVFFHTSGRKISHVGVYLLNNKFVHASTSGGVMVSDLNDTYWRPRYRGAGRIGKL